MYGFIGNIGPWELVFILLVALIVVGPGKLPEVARSMGKALSDFKRVTSGVQKDFQDALKFDEEPKKNFGSSKKAEPSNDESIDVNNDAENKSEDEEDKSEDTIHKSI